MSIEFGRSYKTSDGECHSTLKDAQKHELELLFKPTVGAVGLSLQTVSEVLIENTYIVVSILTMTERSRPKARGAKKPRKNRIIEPATTTAA